MYLPEKQWEADTTQSRDINEPPHICVLLWGLDSSATCHGHAPGGLVTPPTMRFSAGGTSSTRFLGPPKKRFPHFGSSRFTLKKIEGIMQSKLREDYKSEDLTALGLCMKPSWDKQISTLTNPETTSRLMAQSGTANLRMQFESRKKPQSRERPNKLFMWLQVKESNRRTQAFYPG